MGDNLLQGTMPKKGNFIKCPNCSKITFVEIAKLDEKDVIVSIQTICFECLTSKEKYKIAKKYNLKIEKL